jgi:hypothetical protein
MNRSAVSVARFLIGAASAAPVAFAQATPSPLAKTEAFAAADAYVCSDPSLAMMPEVSRSCGVILFCSDADARGVDESRWA